MRSKQKGFMFVLVGVLSLGLSSCCSLAKFIAGTPDVIGSWKLKDSDTTLTFRQNNTFQVDMRSDGIVDIWGTYEIFENRLKFADTQAEKISDCLTPGFYLYSVCGKNLNFELFADECLPRKQILNKAWQSIPTIPEKDSRKADTGVAR